jgi:hypothetical protein
MRLFSVLFWGVFLLASGIAILLGLFLKLNIHAGRLIFGLFVLLVGVSLLTSNLGWDNFKLSDGNTIDFSSWEKVEAQDRNEYFVVFGSAIYDLTKLEPGAMVKINCAFGSCMLRLPSGKTRVIANSAFGTIHLPDSSISFGTKDKEYGSGDVTGPRVEITCSFGGATVAQ